MLKNALSLTKKKLGHFKHAEVTTEKNLPQLQAKAYATAIVSLIKQNPNFEFSCYMPKACGFKFTNAKEINSLNYQKLALGQLIVTAPNTTIIGAEGLPIDTIISLDGNLLIGKYTPLYRDVINFLCPKHLCEAIERAQNRFKYAFSAATNSLNFSSLDFATAENLSPQCAEAKAEVMKILSDVKKYILYNCKDNFRNHSSSVNDKLTKISDDKAVLAKKNESLKEKIAENNRRIQELDAKALDIYAPTTYCYNRDGRDS